MGPRDPFQGPAAQPRGGGESEAARRVGGSRQPLASPLAGAAIGGLLTASILHFGFAASFFVVLGSAVGGIVAAVAGGRLDVVGAYRALVGR